MSTSSPSPAQRPSASGEAPAVPSRSLRGLVYQLIAVLVLALGVYVIASNTQENLQRLGVQPGLDFLWQPAGFEINQKLIAFDAGSPIVRAMLVAVINTLLLCGVAIAGASVVGLGVGIARLSRSAPMRLLAGAFVEFFRNVPVLLQVFLWYFLVLRALPDVRVGIELFDAVYLNNRGLFLPMPASTTGVSAGAVLLIVLLVAVAAAILARHISRSVQDRTGRLLPASLLWLGVMLICVALVRALGVPSLTWVAPTPTRFGFEGGYAFMPEFIALAVALSLYNAAYIAEIVRSALQASPRGQAEAAYALGLSRARTFRLVLLPQALRMIVPPLATVYQNVLKSSALGAAIAYPELTSVLVGSVNNIVGQPAAIIGITLIVYLVLSMVIAALMHWYEHRISRWS